MPTEELDTNPLPYGDLALQTIAMPRDTNANGDIFGGWLLSQMDLAGSITASELGGEGASQRSQLKVCRF